MPTAALLEWNGYATCPKIKKLPNQEAQELNSFDGPFEPKPAHRTTKDQFYPCQNATGDI
jgi:hypothetical protein